MRSSRFALLAFILTAGLIAGCGSSSSSTTSARPAAVAVPNSSAAGALVATKHAKLGTVLAYGPKHLTAYLFESDSSTHSTCTGQCTQVWPPVTGKPSAGAGAVSADLGTIKRSDGIVQVTYKGHPLYGFAKDQDHADVYGQGIKSFGSAWYVLAPSGIKIDAAGDSASGAGSASSSSSTSSASGTGYSSNGY